ncbi:MAG: GGDEF domain-containing protein [Steroidobacteraceae bacterium]
MHEVIAQLLNETLAMQISTRALSQQLEARANEVAILTEQLERVQTEALLDPLCGLKNRRGLERSAQSILDAGLSGTALLIADVDHFKRVNDTYGHVFGDKVLRAIAGTMQANIKGRDIAARIGGDEFAALLPQTTLQGALALGEYIRAAVADGRIHRGDGKDIVGSFTLSIGVAVRNPGEPFEDLMERADAALYAAKRDGRNCIRVAPPA